MSIATWLNGIFNSSKVPANTVIPVDIEVGERDQVVLLTTDRISIEQANSIAEAWDTGITSGKPIVLSGNFRLTVLRNARKVDKETRK